MCPSPCPGVPSSLSIVHTPPIRPPCASRPLHTCHIHAHFVHTCIQVQPLPIRVHVMVGKTGAMGRGSMGTWVHTMVGEMRATGRGSTGAWVHATAGKM